MKKIISFTWLKKLYFSILVLFWLVFVIENVFPQDKPESSKRSNQINTKIQQTSFLIYRFEQPTSPGPAFDGLRKHLYNLKKEDVQKIAIRICSKDNLLLSLPSAVTNPFDILELMAGSSHGIKDLPPIYFLRSRDCISSKIANMHAIEIWAISDDGSLPQHIESYRYEDIKIISLGFDPSVCSTAKNDYKKAVKTLIKELRDDSNSFGVIIGYYYPFNEKPDSKLQKKIEKIRELMQKSNLSKNRYEISYQLWHADDSDCAGEPVKTPSVFFITKANGQIKL